MNFEIRSASFQQPLKLRVSNPSTAFPFCLMLTFLVVLAISAYEIPQANAGQSQDHSSGHPVKARPLETPKSAAPIDEELIQAAKSGDLAHVKTLLKKGAEVKAVGAHGETALGSAAREGHTEIVELLLDAGADLRATSDKYYGKTALIGAADKGHLEIVQLLLKRVSQDNWKEAGLNPALWAAVRKGHLEIVKVLLEKDPDNNAKHRCDTGLTVAAETGQLDVVKLLLDRGADVNARHPDGTTALMHASRGGHVEMVKLFLGRGADVNAVNNMGETALTFGRDRELLSGSRGGGSRGRVEVAKMLIDSGALHKWDVYRILFWVINGGNSEIAELLLKGADLNFNFDKKTNIPFEPPLIWAARGGEAKVVRILVECGADINIKDPVGRTALKMARDQGHEEIVEYLKANGAKE